MKVPNPDCPACHGTGDNGDYGPCPLCMKESPKSVATTTFPPLVRKIGSIIGNGSVIQHDPTKNNPLGQSGLHTLIDDILDIVNTAPTERQAVKDLWTYFKEGEL